ncbi:DUF1801 domain-containing protein [Chitinivorax sp. PXF-14]|uniref:DUF1801 domain-containing protein n=1 Tax=Chitinivorax sp. PXF-14 TaxID=3230488 RepID=UPI0034663084
MTMPPKPGKASDPQPTQRDTPAPAGPKLKPIVKVASSLIDERIQALGGWRGAMLTEARRLIHEALPDILEECKWIKPSNPLGVPVWSCGGIICTGEIYKQAVKLTFMRGAALADPHGLFNASLDGNVRRAIDLHEGDTLDAAAFKALIQAAVAENLRSGAAKSRKPGQ